MERVLRVLVLCFLWAFAVIPKVYPQALVQPDCMLTFLGKPLKSDSVRTALSVFGIVITQEEAQQAKIAKPADGYLLKTTEGILNEIVLFNDSVTYQGQVFRGYRLGIPHGLTFDDSVGVEENLLFRQKAANYKETSDGKYLVSVLTLSDGITYQLEQAYTPANAYFYYKRQYPKQRVKRNLYFRYSRVTTPKGPYLKLPLYCGSSSGGSFSTGVFANRTDSAYYFGIYSGGRGLSRAKGMRQSVNDGSFFGINLFFPVNAKLSPPLAHIAGFDYASYNYRDSTKTLRTSSDGEPSHNQLSFYYGLGYIPLMKENTGFLPVAQAVVGAQFDYSPLLFVYSNEPAKRSRSSSLFYQFGVGGGYKFESGLILQLMAHYRATKFVRYLRYNTFAYDAASGAEYPNLQVFGTRLNSISIELNFRINIYGY